MAKWTTKARADYYKAHPENCAGPDGSYPIKDRSDVADAWDLAGHAANPDAVRANIKRIAKRLGFSDALPETAKEEDSKDGGGTSRAMATKVTVDAHGKHAPFTGTHTHAHAAMGSQGDDALHEHEHSHDNDAEHGHSHEDGETSRAIAIADAPNSLYMPVTRAYTNADGDWIVQGRGISDVVHQYGKVKTMFDYESAKRAFERWPGNVREQHNDKKAVGRGLNWTPDDTAHAVDLTARVSKGAPDTWEKLNDGTLTGFSVNLKPGFKTSWETINGERVLRYYDYDYAEISLVDVPGIPGLAGLNVAIVRADGMINTDVVDISEAATEASGDGSVQAMEKASDVDRAGAVVSSQRMGSMHAARDSALLAARQMAASCPCQDCCRIANMLDPDSDGDVDIPGSTLDTDHDAEQLAARVVDIVERRLAPTVLRYQAIAGDMSRLAVPPVDLEPVQRALDGFQSRMEAMDEQVKRLGAIEQMVKEIHETPMPGGPVLRSPDKRLITDPAPQSVQGNMSDAEVMRRATEMGIVDPRRMSPQQQVSAALSVIQPLQS